MAVDFFFRAKNSRYQDINNEYLHFFAQNSRANPQGVYAAIENARNLIANMATQSTISTANSKFATTPMDTETRETLEKFLSGRLFSEMSGGVPGDGNADLPASDNIAAVLNSISNEFNSAATNVTSFGRAAENVINQIFSANNISMTAREYAGQVLKELLNSYGGAVTTGQIANQIVRSVLEKNNGNFFTVDVNLGSSNVSKVVAQMAALIATLPEANFDGQTVAVGTAHLPIETALERKFNSWMGYLNHHAGRLANAIGLADVASRSYDELDKVNVKIGATKEASVKIDPSFSSDSAAVKQAAASINSKQYSNNIVQISAGKNGVTATIGIQTRGGSSNPITPNSQQRTFNIIEDSNLFAVLTRDAMINGSTLNQLIQILTYHDSRDSNYEDSAAETWNEITRIVPYIAAMTRLTMYLSNTNAAFDNVFFALGGKVWPAGVVVQHILGQMSYQNGSTNSAAYFSGNIGGREQFVGMNQWIMDKRPSPEAGSIRSAELHSAVLGRMQSIKVSVKIRLAELAALSMRSL